jgi:hypothetical protein
LRETKKNQKVGNFRLPMLVLSPIPKRFNTHQLKMHPPLNH